MRGITKGSEEKFVPVMETKQIASQMVTAPQDSAFLTNSWAELLDTDKPHAPVFIDPELGMDLFPKLETAKGQMVSSSGDVLDELPTVTFSFKAVSTDHDALQSHKTTPHANASKNQNGGGVTTPLAPSDPASTGRPVRQARLKRKKLDPDFVETVTDDERAEERANGHHNAKWCPQNRPEMLSLRNGAGNMLRSQNSEQLVRPQSELVGPPSIRTVILYPIDVPHPRRQRSAVNRRPRASRTSINRLKQAAHGILPLGERSSVAFSKEGSALVSESDAEESNVEEELDIVGDSDKARVSTVTGTSSRGTGAVSDRPVSNLHPPGSDPNLLLSGPSLSQRRRMEEIAAAPPHLRQIMLQQLMREQLGFMISGPCLSSLPRDQQKLVVHQLLTRMTPQQRHDLLQLTALQQAALLQHYYQQNAGSLGAPAPIQSSQTPKVQSLHPLSEDNKAQVRNFLATLNPQAQMQLANLPKEQKQLVLLRIAQHCQTTANLQAQVQSPLPSTLTATQLAARATIWPSCPIVAASYPRPQALPNTTSGRQGPAIPAPTAMQMPQIRQGIQGMQSMDPPGGVCNPVAMPDLLAQSGGGLLEQDDLLDDADALDEAVKYFLDDRA